MFFKKKYIFVILTLFFFQPAHTENPYFLDFKYILNESNAGKKAQTFLKNKLEKGFKDIKSKEKALQDEEK